MLLFLFTTLGDAKIKVHVINTLEGVQDLQLHCKSKNNDLGLQVVHPGQYFMIKFNPNIWGTTLFFCSFSWAGELHYFDIYKAARGDKPVCPDDVILWEIRKSGPCFMTCMRDPYQRCYRWN
ncbi:hypothetical protein Tsubulata_047977 [Turnera subulata]|uniref:S-protein homolog n=1 Tax=Turnera subulata TaxID=218843 RepID=A0A9Q0FZN1_9ROSI|nr:hypothetical protein Tsubulata_047977 [Turnera subulata]